MESSRRRFLQMMLLGAAGVAAVGLGRASLDRSGSLRTSDPPKAVAPASGGATVTCTVDRLLTMPQTSVQAGLWCDDTPITEGTWTGVSLGQLLENAGIDRGTATVKFSAEDDYSISMSVSDAQSSNAIVALSKDDSPLQETLRLVVPGGNGSLWVKGSSITIAASSTG